ncbi:zinc-binding dehydrogenase [Plantibacter sp. Mn2098]|uniref:zinc-binding dehydrogenase n=1 Tax=Plantibacter sp. Mn2098 TaxID=3395266 RepID=UPI003BD0D00C
MRALQLASDSVPMLSFVDVAEPAPQPNEAVISVCAASINYGDAGYLEPGAGIVKIGGYDGSGVVLRAAVDGSGPGVGTRVAFLTPNGTWAERCAVRSSDLAELPASVSFVDAAALPAAGLTALGALDEVARGSRSDGPDGLDGRHVTVLGATSGVGQLAVQLAVLRGASVTAVVRDLTRTEHLAELGASETVGADDEWAFGTDVVVDLVGGPLLERAVSTLRPRAHVLAIGNASHRASTIDFEQLRRNAPGSRFVAYTRTDTSAPDLERLLGLVEDGALVVPVGWSGSWEDAATALQLVSERRVVGKAVLEIPTA